MTLLLRVVETDELFKTMTTHSSDSKCRHNLRRLLWSRQPQKCDMKFGDQQKQEQATADNQLNC